MSRLRVLALTPFVLAIACSSKTDTTGSNAPKTDAQYRQQIAQAMHDRLLDGIREMRAGAVKIQTAAPTPDGRGWDAEKDAAAIASMKAAWIEARTAYEHIEGAIAPLFPDIDASIDARYDDFMTELGGKGDPNPFDGEGVTGMHAIERILFLDTTPENVKAFEVPSTMPGARPAALPASHDEAVAFKEQLCGRLIADIDKLETQWQPQAIDVAGAFQGLVSLMNEQREKVIKASTFEEESRYAQRTMADIRANLEGTTAAYAIFEPWLLSKSEGKALDDNIQAGFGSLKGIYDGVKGDAIPQPPATWSSEHPSDGDLASDFGKLYVSVRRAVDPSRDGSLVEEMNQAARVLGFPEFVEGK